MSEKVIELSEKIMSDSDKLVEDVKEFLKNDYFKAFFKNQQKFIHLYLLSKECEVTAQRIRDIVETKTMDRKFSPQTYYRLRLELQENGWIEYVLKLTDQSLIKLRKDIPENIIIKLQNLINQEYTSEDKFIEDLKLTTNTDQYEALILKHAKSSEIKPGITETPHRIKKEDGKLKAFTETFIATSTIERPLSISKYHLFDMGLKFSNLAKDGNVNLGKLREFEGYLGKLESEYSRHADFMFYPDFLLRTLAGDLAVIIIRDREEIFQIEVFSGGYRLISARDDVSSADDYESKEKAAAKDDVSLELTRLDLENKEKQLRGVIEIDEFETWEISGWFEVQSNQEIELLLPGNVTVGKDRFIKKGNRLEFNFPLEEKIDLSKIKIKVLTDN
jgi:hypothetical protein